VTVLCFLREGEYVGFLWEQMFCAEAGEEEHTCWWGGMAGSELTLALCVSNGCYLLGQGQCSPQPAPRSLGKQWDVTT